MDVIKKYILEARIKNNIKDIKDIILSPKNSTFELNGDKITMNVVPGTIILEYPSTLTTFTYNLIKVCDDIGYDFTEIGVTAKTTKFIISNS